MNMLKKILVFPAGSEIGLEVYASLRHCMHFSLIGGISVSDHAEFLYNKTVLLPFIDDDNFIDALNTVIESNEIDAIYPAMDKALFVLGEHASEIKCKVIGSEFESIKICYSKSATYNYFQNFISTPEVYPKLDEVKIFPAFVKPDKGYGSRGVAILKNVEEGEQILKQIEEPLILEYLPGEEYTIDCFTDRNGKLLYAQPRKRSRTRMGISVRTTFYEDQDTSFQSFAHSINQHLKIRGAWFFQLKRDLMEDLKLLEIGLRIAGSSSINRLVGVNLSLLTLYDAFDKDVQINPLKLNPVVDRAFNVKAEINISFDNIFIDFDDCLIVDHSVNSDALSLLFNALNAGKKIFLITRHNKDLNESLIFYRLQNLFDGIFHIGEVEKKSTFIKPKSIFIDDSFAERNEVYTTLGIPVFGVDTIPILNSMISWKKK